MTEVDVKRGYIRIGTNKVGVKMKQAKKLHIYVLLVTLTMSLVVLVSSLSRVAFAQSATTSFDLELSHFVTGYLSDCAVSNYIEISNQQTTSQSLDNFVVDVMGEEYSLSGITIAPNATYWHRIPTYSNLHQQFETLFFNENEQSQDALLDQLRPTLIYVDPMTDERVTVATAGGFVPSAAAGFSVFDTIVCGAYIQSVDTATGADGRVTLSQVTIAYDDPMDSGITYYAYQPFSEAVISFPTVINRTGLVVGNTLHSLRALDVDISTTASTNPSYAFHLIATVTIPDGVELLVPADVDSIRLAYSEDDIDERLLLNTFSLNVVGLQTEPEPTAVTLSADSITTPLTLHFALLTLLILTGSTTVVIRRD